MKCSLYSIFVNHEKKEKNNSVYNNVCNENIGSVGDVYHGWHK